MEMVLEEGDKIQDCLRKYDDLELIFYVLCYLRMKYKILI